MTHPETYTVQVLVKAAEPDETVIDKTTVTKSKQVISHYNEIKTWVPEKYVNETVVTAGYYRSVTNIEPGYYKKVTTTTPGKYITVRKYIGNSKYENQQKWVPGTTTTKDVWVPEKKVTRQVWVPEKTQIVKKQVGGGYYETEKIPVYKTEYYDVVTETPRIVKHPAIYKSEPRTRTIVDVPEYQKQTGTEPGEYGWTIKSTVRIQTKWNEHTTAPTSAQDMNDALDTMQGVLDFLGFLPLFGSAADAINTAMSILRADYLAAMLNSVGLMGGIYSNVITAPFKMLLAAADNADKFSAALKTFKAAVGIVGDATSYISNMFDTMKNLILNVTSNISEVTKASAFGLLSKEMKDKLAGFLEMIGTGISKAMTAIQAQVDELTGKVKAEWRNSLVNVSNDTLISGVKHSEVNPLSNIKYTDKVLEQMKQGDFHGFPDIVDNYGSNGVINSIKGGDEIIRTKITIPGNYKGKDGVFEYIIEPDGVTCNHRFFQVNY